MQSKKSSQKGAWKGGERNEGCVIGRKGSVMDLKASFGSGKSVSDVNGHDAQGSSCRHRWMYGVRKGGDFMSRIIWMLICFATCLSGLSMQPGEETTNFFSDEVVAITHAGEQCSLEHNQGMDEAEERAETEQEVLEEAESTWIDEFVTGLEATGTLEEEKQMTQYSPVHVAEMATAKCIEGGMVETTTNLDALLESGQITREEHDEYYPYDGLGYYSVFVETDLSQASTTSGRKLESEEGIADYLAGMLLLEREPYFLIEYAGVTSLGSTEFHEFRCYR